MKNTYYLFCFICVCIFSFLGAVGIVVVLRILHYSIGDWIGYVMGFPLVALLSKVYEGRDEQ